MWAREAGTAMCVGERRACNMDSQSCCGEGEKLVGAVGHLLALQFMKGRRPAPPFCLFSALTVSPFPPIPNPAVLMKKRLVLKRVFCFFRPFNFKRKGEVGLVG